jgi:hypothetical protein
MGANATESSPKAYQIHGCQAFEAVMSVLPQQQMAKETGEAS